MELSVHGILEIVFSALVGYLMWDLKRLRSKVDASMSKEEVRQMIEDLLKPIDQSNAEVKQDLKEIERSISNLTIMIVKWQANDNRN